VSPLRDRAERRLQELLGLSPERAARALDEVLDTLCCDVDTYIGERHAELRAQGVGNAEIYERIAAELPALRFKVALSARQIRRRIYG
jgi:hypothetical protein